MATITKVAVYYDGNFFAHVSNYYAYSHPRKARINVQGLHDFIRHRVAEEEQTDLRYTQIVDAHYYRGRRSADVANLHGERLFDTVLMRAGVVTHYLPLTQRGEKGIDVLLALEAFESAILRRYDVLALVAGDSDFVPLVRKLGVAGARVMIVGFDAKYVDQSGQERETRTAQALLDVATYPVMVSTMVDDRTSRGRPGLDNLFVDRTLGWNAQPFVTDGTPPGYEAADDEMGAGAPASDGVRFSGTIKLIKDGYGFIVSDERAGDVFFHHADTRGDFADLQTGMRVAFTLGQNDRGTCAREVEVVPN